MVGGVPNVIQSMPSASINFCAAPANAVPCTNKVTTYTDSTLLTACATSTQVVLAGTTSCVAKSDTLGNWGVWAPPGQYTYTITNSQGKSFGPYSVTLSNGAGGGNGVNATATSTTYNFVQADCGKLVLAQNSAPMTFTLPAATALSSTCVIAVENLGSSQLTVVAPAATIDGGSGSIGVTIPPVATSGVPQALTLYTDGASAYWALRGIAFTGSFTGPVTIVGDVSVTGNLNVSGNVTQTGTGAWQFSSKIQAVNSVTVPGGSDFSLFVGLNQKMACQMSSTFSGVSCMPAEIITTSAYTNATTTFSNVTDGTNNLAFPVAATGKYTAVCRIMWQGSAGTTGPKFQFTGPASPTAVAAYHHSPITTSTYLDSSATAFSTSMPNTGTITTATNFLSTVSLQLVNGANAGTVQLQAAANGAGTLTIQPGSSCVVF